MSLEIKQGLIFNELYISLNFIAFFKMNVCFCKKQLVMQVPAKRNASCSTGFECLISHWLTRRGGRTYVRSDISDVITLPKFFACMHLLYSLTHGALLRARSSAIINKIRLQSPHGDFGIVMKDNQRPDK